MLRAYVHRACPCDSRTWRGVVCGARKVVYSVSVAVVPTYQWVLGEGVWPYCCSSHPHTLTPSHPHTLTLLPQVLGSALSDWFLSPPSTTTLTPSLHSHLSLSLSLIQWTLNGAETDTTGKPPMYHQTLSYRTTLSQELK